MWGCILFRSGSLCSDGLSNFGASVTAVSRFFRFDDVTMLSQPWYDVFAKLEKNYIVYTTWSSLFRSNLTLFIVLLWRSVTMWMNLLEFIKVLFLKVLQLCKLICAALTCCLQCCATTALASWQEDIALDKKPCDVKLSGKLQPHRSFAKP